MTDQRVAPGGMTCDEATELAGLYVLNALDPSERMMVEAHIADCPEAHAEIGELGGVVPSLANMVEPLDAPADLKLRVLDGYRAELALQAAPATVVEVPREAAREAPPMKVWEPDITEPQARQRGRLPDWAAWVAATAAILVLAVVGVYALGLRDDADAANQRAAQLEQAIAALSAPGSTVAILHGTEDAAGANGFAAFPADGGGFIVMSGLAEPPAGQVYQAWYIVDGQPTSAGTMTTVETDSYTVVSGLQPVPGTQVVALTLEPAGGSEQPTSAPIVVGEVSQQG